MEEDKKEKLRQYHRDYYKNNKERRKVINARYWRKKIEKENDGKENEDETV